MFSALDAAIARLYPSRTWGQPDDIARFQAGVDESDVYALAEEIAQELEASTFVRLGADDEYCNYIYIQCVGREPNLVQLRDGGVALPEELTHSAGQETERIDEQYLRLAVSDIARFAAAQQVAMHLEPGDPPLIREVPRPGVYDAPLLRRFQRLVALLPAYDIVHLDFGEISAPIEGFAPGEYAKRYGGTPHRANYIFYPQPSNMQIATALVPR